MSTAVLPSLPGLTYPVGRSPVWDTVKQPAVSGKETRVALQTYPRWKWSATFSVLRSAAAYAEFQQLVGFFNQRQGGFDTFLYADADDYSTLVNLSGGHQQIGVGDGATLTYQLVRAFGGFIEPVLAPNAVATVYVDGVDQVGHWTVSDWGTAAPGVVTFASGYAPTSGKAVTADFTYYWPCRFDQDECQFSLFMNQYYELKKLAWESVKN